MNQFKEINLTKVSTRRFAAWLTFAFLWPPAVVASADVAAACTMQSNFSGQKEWTLDDTVNLSIVGFKPSFQFVTVPDGAYLTLPFTNALFASHTNSFSVLTRTIKIHAASEEALVTLEGGVLTIEPKTCQVPSNKSPEQDPSSSSAAAASGIRSLAMLLFPFSFGSPSTAILLVAPALTLVVTGVDADSGTAVCQPVIDIEISVPYDCPYNNFVDTKCLTPRMIADMAVQALFIDFDTNAAKKLLATDYIQHNPMVPTGATSILDLIPVLADSGLGIEVHRTIEEGNLVAYHSTYNNATLFGAQTMIGFDVFRVENGQVQEHWDNLQEIAGPNPSGNTMVNGPTMMKYLKETNSNKALAVRLVETVLVGGNASAAPLFISATEYTQHNPDIPDGLDGLGTALTTLAESGLSISYDSVQLVVAQGNFVLLGSPGEFGEGNPTAFYDLFRFENGLIVEHWDVIESIPSPNEFAHSNGKF